MSRTRRNIFAAAAAIALSAAIGTAQNYIEDVRFKATSLDGWHTLGDASWKAEKGEYIGTPKSPAGGWLVLDKSYQDVGIFGNFKCTGGCKTGVLLRAEKTPEGMKGLYVALTGEEVASYAVKLDASGKELSREKLRSAGGQIRFAPAPAPAAAGGRGGRGGGGRAAAPAGLPIVAPTPGLKADDWNHLEILLDATIVRPFLNDSPIAGAAAEDSTGKYGPIAFYIGGTGEVRFKDLAYSDLGVKTLPLEKTSSNFRMQRLNDFYYSWGAAAADFNHDGVLDIAAGP